MPNPTVIIPPDMKSDPEKHEVEVAWLLARHYHCVIEFIKPIDSYKVKTPDIIMRGALWEIKSPTGASYRRTVGSQFNKGVKQSRLIVFDGRRTKLPDAVLQRHLLFEMQKRRSVKRIIFVTKTSEIIEIFRRKR